MLTQSAQPASYYFTDDQRRLRSTESSESINAATPITSSTGPHSAYAGQAAVAYRQTSPMGFNNTPQPVPVMFCRAIYSYDADDRTSLSFHEGDIIQVITQLESGWWDGVINGVRGWFPSNYCAVINNPEDILDDRNHDDADDDEEEEDQYNNEHYGDDVEADSLRGDGGRSTGEGFSNGDKARADFWIPQATPDGRLFYYNTMTGESSMELPLESPSSTTENGPRDRMTVNVPETTQPPPEMFAQAYGRDEEYETDASATELDGVAGRSFVVSHLRS